MNLDYFNTKTLFEAGTKFFEDLNIPINTFEDSAFKPEDVLHEKYNPKNLSHQLIEKIYVLGIVDDSAFKGKTNFDSYTEVQKLGGDYSGLVVLAVELKTHNPLRSQLSEITRVLNRSFIATPVTVIYKYGNCIALANSERIPYAVRFKEGEKVGKVTMLKDIQIIGTNTAHLRIIFGDSRNVGLRIDNSEIQNFRDLYKYWHKQFSLQSLNDQFYKDLQDWFYYSLSHIKLPEKPDYIDDLENKKNFLVRLLSRIIFCWFLKEKGLIKKELLEIKDWKGNILPLTKDYKNSEFLNSNSYYRGILQNIFFKALNQKNKKAEKDFKWTKYLASDFDYSKFTDIPFLNAGIFDVLPEEDNAKETMSDDVLKIPNYLFYGKNELSEVTIGKGAKKQTKLQEIKHKGLNEILSEYKFTLAENTPFEEDIALDPEMLGLVFENLLAELDPNLEESTKKSIRNLTGSYYTPRKIIYEMVNDSLNIYLTKYIEQHYKHIIEATKKVSDLVYSNKIEDESIFNDAVVDALDQFKFLDPACGSGAFPLVALHRITDILKVVDPVNEKWVELKLKKVDAQNRIEFKKVLTQHMDDYGRKLGIIRDSIYGIDIQPMAVQITKLRFFISLLVDQNSQKEITPMPNIESKIICADSLKNIQPDLFAFTAIENLKDARTRYYQPNNSKEEKEAIADEIVEILNDAFPKFANKITGKESSVRNKALLKAWFEHGTISAPFFNLDFFYPEIAEHGGFDCVMGNPPYGGFKIEDEVRNNLDITSKDPYGAFIARFINSGDRHNTPLKDGGVLSYIVSDTFMTIKTHYNLRKHLMNHAVHKMLRVHPDTFRATVNTAIILVEKLPKDQSLGEHISLMADLTNLSIHDDYDAFIEVLKLTRGTNFTTLDNISNPTFAVYHYPQKLIRTNSNLPFFVASPKLFALMNDGNDKTNKPQIIIKNINGKTANIRSIDINGKKVEVVKLGDIADVCQGLATGDNYAYLYQSPEARGNYHSIEDFKDFLLTDNDLEIIRKDEQLRLDIINNGLNVTDPKSKRYFGGRYIIPHDKGGESDSSIGWLPNYYVPTDYFIDWKESSVFRMKTLTIGKRDGNDREELCAVFRNPTTYFKKGITYSTAGFYAPSFRIGSTSVYGHRGTTIFNEIHSPENLLAILCSKIYKYFIKSYANHTVASEAGTFDSIPTIVDLNCEIFVKNIIDNQKINIRYDYASHEQIEIDKLVYEAYGLNGEDILEVENWYARRYPKLSNAQKANLRTLGKTDDYLELYGLK